VTVLLLLALPLATLVVVTTATQTPRDAVALRLQFPQDLEAAEVESFLVGVTGWLRPWWTRWLGSPHLCVEIHARAGEIQHFLIFDQRLRRPVEHLLQATVPRLRYERVEAPAVQVTQASEYRLTTSARPLRVDAIGIANKLLVSLQPEAESEVVVQWLVQPAPPVRLGAQQWPQRLGPFGAAPRAPEDSTALRHKQAHPLLLATGRIGARMPRGFANDLIRNTQMAWHGARAPGAHLQRRWLPSTLVARRLRNRTVPRVEWSGTFNVQELTGLIGWPLGSPHLTGLTLSGQPLLPPTAAIPSVGTVIGDSLAPGRSRPLALELQARFRGVHIIGTVGTGKSTVLLNMVVSDLAAGHGVVVIDAERDLINDILERVPPHRSGDVIVLDPADRTRPVGLNPLRAADADRREVVVENLALLTLVWVG